MFSSGKAPQSPEDNLAITALLPSVYLFSKVDAFEQSNSLPGFKHLHLTAPVHLQTKIYMSSAVTAFVYTCSCAQTPKSGSVSVEDPFSTYQSLFRALWSTMTVFIWLHLMAVDIFPLQTDAF